MLIAVEPGLTRRRRAPAMSPEDRRAAIIQATLPLLAEHGANVTTKQIAQAADIAEGTVFRAFADKEELVRTCVHEALRTDKVAAEIRQVPADLDLPDRMVQSGELLLAHFARLGNLMNALATSGYDLRKGREEQHSPDGDQAGAPKSRADFIRAPREALTELLEPDRHRFRMSLERISGMYFGLLVSLHMEPNPAEHDLHAEAVARVDVLLHGVLQS